MADEKYLGLDGVRHLWTAITDHDKDTLDAAKKAIKDLALSYDSANKKIILSGTGAENEVSIDATAFIKDGVLDSVQVITAGEDLNIDGVADGEKFIEFTWNADSGKTTSLLPVSDFAKAYMGSDSIDITNSNEIVVKSVDTNKTKVTEDIPVAGGPLADLLLAKGITSINAGTDMQALLFSLFCEVLYPESTTPTDGTFKSTIAAPVFTLKDKNGNNATSSKVEVGTEYTLSQVYIPSEAVPAVNTYPKVSGFTYGYSAADDNSKDSSDTVVTGTANGDPTLTSTNYTMKIDYTNFKYANDSTVNPNQDAADIDITADADYSKVVYAGAKLAAVNGDNTVKVSITGPEAQGSFNAIEPHYACTNTGKTNDGTKPYYVSPKLDAKDNVKSGKASNSKTITVKAGYKYFIGCYSDEVFANKVYTSESLRETDVKKSDFMNGTTISYEITVPAGTKGMYIAIPADVDSTGATLDVKQKTNSNNPVNEEMVANIRNLTLNCAGTATKSYNVFTWSFPGGTAGNEIFTISKF